MLREVAVTQKYAAWLDQVILVNNSMFNADRHETWRLYGFQTKMRAWLTT